MGLYNCAECGEQWWSGNGGHVCKPKEIKMETCSWHLEEDDWGMWKSSCGKSWIFTDDGPKENGMNFCHSCGKPLVVAELVDPIPEPDSGMLFVGGGVQHMTVTLDGVEIRSHKIDPTPDSEAVNKEGESDA